MGQQIRVLVSDDHEDAADALGTLLRDSGCDVRVVHDGRRAAEVAQSFEPQVVILDLLMPHLNGFETAAVLKPDAPP